MTDALDRNDMIWHDRIFDAFHRTTLPELVFEGGRHPLGSLDQKHASLRTVLSVIRASTPDQRDRRVRAILDALEVRTPETSGWDKLTWDQAREMRSQGIDFGSHTIDHSILSRVEPDEARRQVRDSKARIEAELDAPVTHFAYPNGRETDFDDATKRILAEEGFRSAVTTITGANDASADPFMLRRVGMWGDDPHLSLLRLARSRLEA